MTIGMILLSYDISNNKLRTRFSKFLSKYGHRLQYSVFEIDNSDTILRNVITQIITTFEKSLRKTILSLFLNCHLLVKLSEWGMQKMRKRI